jgi:two-component system cell cycle sensor histidine kinase/response regulator CckA
MTYSGATQVVETARSRMRERFPGAVSNWSRAAETVWGPLLTLAALIAIDQLVRHGNSVPYAFPILLFTVVLSATLGGYRTGLISAVLTILYGVHFFSKPGLPLRYDSSGVYSLAAVMVVALGITLLVSRLRELAARGREAELTRAEAEALDRRISFFSQVSATLASSLDYEVTLRDLARILVPTIADWCAIHVVDERGLPRCIAAAHRDPARDFLVRVLSEHGDRRLPFPVPHAKEPQPLEVTEELLRSLAEDDEHRKLYRRLKPTWVLLVPLHAGGRLAGVITLAMSKEYGRRFDAQDLRYARDLGERCTLAIGAGHAYHEARDADHRYRLLFDANPQPMWVFDVGTLEFLAVNDAAVRRYGYSREDFLSMNIMDIQPPDDGPQLPMALPMEQQQETAFTRHQRKDGTVIDVEIVSHELEIDGRRARLVLVTDVSDRARTRAALHHSQEQLRQAQRLDAVGRLAAGVAHDFNNILTTIRGFGDLLHRQLDEQDPRRADADQIRKAADRGIVLTGQLLSFGQRSAPAPRLLDLHASIQAMEGLVRRLLGADIRLDLRLLQGRAMVRMDPGHVEQMLVNLVLNARDAMRGGGVLTLETAEREIGQGARSRRVRPGTYLLLAVRDTGLETDGGSRGHLFDPFHPADPREQRAGFGLSIVYGIVRQAGGAVRVSSEPDQGTTVKVYLPKAETDEPTAERRDVQRSHETVLVVEDEDGVRELVRQVLTAHGHAVLTARHGRDALLMAERYERPIDLLVTDVVMPEMGGGELVDRLTARRPDLKVLYMSGYTSDEVVRRGIDGAGLSFLHKPFTSEALMERVREVLRRQPATT